MYREGRISLATERMATRITRTLADQLQAHLPRPESINKRILIGCAEGEPDELSAQMCSDLFEAEGWDVYFLGSGVPNDEILSLTGKLRPDILLMFLTQKEGVESMQQLVELIRNIGSNPTMNVMVSGTVDREVKSLGKESKPDLIAKTAGEALAIATAAEPRVPVIRMDRAPRKRRRRRKVAPETAGAK
jgi:methanogenic corrinoid protein MtbC1